VRKIDGETSDFLCQNLGPKSKKGALLFRFFNGYGMGLPLPQHVHGKDPIPLTPGGTGCGVQKQDSENKKSKIAGNLHTH